MLVQHGEGSGTPTEPHHTPSPEALLPSPTTHSSPTLPPVTTTFIPAITPSETIPIRQYIHRARIAQSSALPTITDEPASPLRDVSQGEACATDFGFIADQDWATIAKSSTLTHDSAPRVTSPAVDDGNDAPIKGRSLDKGEVAAERISDDSEEMATILTSMDAATVLAGGIADVPTCSRSIPTASPPVDEVPTGSDVFPTASLVFATATMVTPYRRRKGKEVMVESKTPKKQRVQEQIVAQSSALPTIIDEPASPLRDVSQGEACATDFGFIADQDWATIAKSSTLTHDSAPRVTSPAADDGNDAPIKGRSLDKGEVAAERISDDSEEMATILTSMDAATVLAGGIADVPTCSRSIPTASPPVDEVPTGSDVFPTASLVFATAT
nr:hypothetical protein [Tanacetum cinerariifolium]